MFNKNYLVELLLFLLFGNVDSKASGDKVDSQHAYEESPEVEGSVLSWFMRGKTRVVNIQVDL